MTISSPYAGNPVVGGAPSMHTTPAPRIGILSRRLATALAMLALYLLFGQLYDTVVATIYAFGSFVAKPAENRWIEMVLVFASGLILPRTMGKASDVFVWLSMVLLLVPAAVLASHESADRAAMAMMFGGVALVKLLCVVFDRIGLMQSWLQLKRGSYSVSMGFPLAILIGVLVLLAIHVRGALSFSFQDVYDIRFDFNASLFFPLNYLLPFAAGPLAGCITAMALEKRNLPMLATVALCGVLFFGFSSHKALMFNPPFVIFGWLFIRHKHGGLLLSIFFAILSIITLFAQGVMLDLLGASFANRLIFIPAQIHYFFFREFYDIGYQFWAESRFGLGLSQSRLPIDSVNYIGLVMAGDASIGANTGWLANGYMNAGIVGIVFYSLILALTLHALDILGRLYSHSLVAAAFLIPVLNIINAIDLLAGFLTGGLLLLIIVFLIAVRPKEDGAA